MRPQIHILSPLRTQTFDVELYILIIRARGLTGNYSCARKPLMWCVYSAFPCSGAHRLLPLRTLIFNVERISRLSVLGGILAITPKHGKYGTTHVEGG